MALSDLPDVLGIEERGAGGSSGDNKHFVTLQEVSICCSDDYIRLSRQG